MRFMLLKAAVECLHDGEGRALARVCINAMDPTYPAQFIVLESQLVNDR